MPRRRPSSPEIEPTRITPRDIVREALSGIERRPSRSLMTALGTVLGVGVLVVVLGLTGSATTQVGERFNVLDVTEVAAQTGPDPVEVRSYPFPDDAEQRATAIRGVRSAGILWSIAGQGHRVAPAPVPPGEESSSTAVIAAGPGMFDTAHASFRQGRAYDGRAERSVSRVAVVGPAIARQLGLADVRESPAIWVDGHAFTVVGILDDVGRHPDMLAAVMVPTSTARELWGDPQPGNAALYADVAPGAAEVVGSQLALALLPTRPDALVVQVPPTPESLEQQVTGDLNMLFLLLGAVSLVIGTVGIANTTLVAVMERTGEIGLRRALGAGPGAIGAQFVLEATVLGFLGGLVGTSVGVLTVVVICAAQQWTAVLPGALVVGAPLLGAGSGLVAGIHPAWRASRIEPLEALRTP